MTSMRAILLEGPMKVRVQQVPVPIIDSNQILIQVKRCGICGSDLHAYARGARNVVSEIPFAGGHELAGIVADVGGAVSGFDIGDRVTFEPVESCGRCEMCKTGLVQNCNDRKFINQGLAEYIAVSPSRLHLLPENLSWAEAALTEPLAVVIHAVREANVHWPHNVVIIGAGTVGLLGLVVARQMGVGFIGVTARYQHQADLAEMLGADSVLLSSKPDTESNIDGWIGDNQVDTVFETVGGQQPVEEALNIVRRGGLVSLLGLTDQNIVVPINSVVVREITIKGSIFYGHPKSAEVSDFTLALRLLGSGAIPVDKFVTHVFPVDQAEEAFAAAADKRSGSVKVQISF
ncbi:alcohol dehydrogenase catalytic domain-containing protein [Dehalococcoidia bacterium]|nr:alcohol dehydrogenase catalytic domain-containing protein [Dehalococcoidia bacterium]